MIFRAILIIAGFALIAVVVYLGYLTVFDQTLVPWFGIASAVLTPSGFAIIGSAFSAPDKLAIRRLSKVPEIQKLIDKATTQEEKLKALQAERTEFLKVVEYEAQTRALEARRSALEADATRILAERDSAETELATLNEEVAATKFSDEVQKLRERVEAKERGDFVIRIFGTNVLIPRSLVTALPFSGYIEVMADLIHSIWGKPGSGQARA